MSELSVIKKESKRGLHLQISDLYLVLTGLCAGLLAKEALAQIMFFCMLGYFFQKSLQEFMEIGLFFLMASFSQGMLVLYQNSLLMIFFVLLILFVRVVHLSVFHAMPWIVSAVGFLVVLVHTSSMILAIQSGILSFVLMKCCSSEKILIQRKFKITEMMCCVQNCILLMGLEKLLSFQQLMFVSVLWLVAASMWFETIHLVVNAGIIFLILHFDVSFIPWMLCVFVLHLLKSMDTGLLVVFPVICAGLNESILSGAEGLLMISLVLCLPKRNTIEFLQQENEDSLLKVRLRNKEQLLQHQLNQFSHIFDTIADFYEDSSQVQTNLLKGMSESMSLLSMQMKQCALSSEDEAYKILELLKGYHYDVQKVYVTQSDTGIRKVSILMNECVRKEIEDVILPLLQMCIDQNLRLVSCEKAHKFSQNWRLEFSGGKPFSLKAKAYQCLDKDQISGDTCSIFTSGNHTICTISDGMGVGKQAKKTSGFVTYLTQRLLSCGMPIEMIVKSINSLCSLQLSENFATLDFMCFDALNHKAVLAKNGAAPSYLIRGKEVLKIEGHALPLGIVHQIHADCYLLDVKAKDILLMCSDGVDEKQIHQWLKIENADELRNTIEKTIHECEKRDDISVIVAEVL